MCHPRTSDSLPYLTALLCLTLAGCAGSNDSGGFLDSGGSSPQGTWEYMIHNAYEATFTGCTGDATVLEGLSFVEGMSLAPICLVSGSFEVAQEGDVVTVVSHPVPCSDGSAGSAGGFAALAGHSLDGQWETSSGSGVSASQTFSSAIAGNTVEMVETQRTFSGSFEGSCSLSPPLSSTATIR